MNNKDMENKLFALFSVKSKEELDLFIETNPEDPRVIELLEALEYMEKNLEQ